MGSLERELARIEQGVSGWDFQEEAFRSALKKTAINGPRGNERGRKASLTNRTGPSCATRQPCLGHLGRSDMAPVEAGGIEEGRNR